MHINATVGTTVQFAVSVIDINNSANNPVTGQTVTAAVRRVSDGKWWDFVAHAWDTFATYALIEASNKQALTDNGDGSYSVAWDQQAADGGPEQSYRVFYAVPSGTYQGMDSDDWWFVNGAPSAAQVAAAVAGTGSKPVTLQMLTDDAIPVPVPNCKLTVLGIGGAQIVVGTTDSTGAIPYALGLDSTTDYDVVAAGPSALYSYANPFAVTTAAGTGAQTVTLTCTAVAIPAPASPDNYLLVFEPRTFEGNAVFDATDISIKVVGAPGAWAILGTSYPVDSNGQCTIEVAKTTDGKRMTIERSWTDAAGDARADKWEATIDGSKANGSDQIAWADLTMLKRP